MKELDSNTPIPEDAMPVWYDNVSDNQIGGITDGITKEVAEDLGYKHPADINDQRHQELTDKVVAIEKRLEDDADNGRTSSLTVDEARTLNEYYGRTNQPKKTKETPSRGADNWRREED